MGVSRDATKEEIKKSYKKLARKYHPDMNKDNKEEAERKFKKISEAYEILADPDKRARYDRFGKEGVYFEGGQFSWEDFTHQADLEDIFKDFFGGFGGGDFFSQIFGQGTRARTGPRAQYSVGEDLRIPLNITLKEAAEGTTKRIKVRLFEKCRHCDGKGGVTTTCSMCNGTGEVRTAHSGIFGQMVSVSTCPACRGTGEVIRDTCPYCYGEGRVKKEKQLSVRIPPGVESDNYITLRGEGNVGRRRGMRGNIIIQIKVKEDSRFIREGNNLRIKIPVSYKTAIEGGEVKIPTLDGRVKITIPPHTNSGKVFVLRGKGMGSLYGRGKGNLLAEVYIWTPKKVSRKAQGLLEELDKELGSSPEL